MEERLQKILAYAGYGSRRSCEELIAAGRVTVNGQVAHLGSKADIQKDQIKLDGKLVKPPEAFRYIALYKPRGFYQPSAHQTLAPQYETWYQLRVVYIQSVVLMWTAKA